MIIGASRFSNFPFYFRTRYACEMFYCRDGVVKFHRDAGAMVFRPNVALTALMDMVPFNSPVRVGLIVRGVF